MTTFLRTDLALVAADPSLDMDILLSGVLVQDADFLSGYLAGVERYHAENEFEHDSTYPWTSAEVTTLLCQTCTDPERSESWRAGLLFGWVCTHLCMRADQYRNAENKNAARTEHLPYGRRNGQHESA